MRQFLLLCCWALLAHTPASAGTLDVRLKTEDGESVTNAVVSLKPIEIAHALERPTAPALMTQQNTQFAPFVLPVTVGTTVTFPNLDEFRHQVYSFSKPKRFELRLYGQDTSNSITFDAPGVVALGCNIHDNMLAFIYVSEHPVVAKSDAEGSVQLQDLPAGSYEVHVWHPDLKKAAPKPVTVTLGEAETQSVNVTVSLRGVRRQQLPPAGEEY